MPQPTTIGGAIVAVLILVGLYCFYRYRNSGKNMEAANKFLEDLSKQIEKIIVEIVSTIDITKYGTLEEFEAEIFRVSYDSIWNFVSVQLEAAIENKAISNVVASLVTRERVESFINLIVDRCGITAQTGSRWSTRIASGNEEAEAFEKEIVERNKQYETGEVPDFDPSTYKAQEYNPEPINGEIVPPTDEVTYSDNDESVEPVDEDIPADIMPESTENFDLEDPEDE